MVLSAVRSASAGGSIARTRRRFRHVRQFQQPDQGQRHPAGLLGTDSRRTADVTPALDSRAQRSACGRDHCHVRTVGRGCWAAEFIKCVAYANAPPYGQQFEGVDIALDNYPYNGVTTTCETLYVGVPVISLYGRNGVSRSGLSLLDTLGLGE